jgi:P27 family predicted phage terminase small subunit
MRGRKPAPTTLKILEGRQPCRINKNEPTAVRGRPQCPDWLDDVAKAKWGQMLDVIEPMGTLTLAEGEALALYCGAFSRYRQALDIIARDGVVPLGPDGSPRRNPAIGIAKDAEAVMLRIQAEFGLSPASRGKVVGLAPEKGDALDELIARGRKPRPESTP